MVGRHLVHYASAQGIRCVTSSRNRPDSLPEHASWQRWDLSTWLEPDAIDLLFGDVDALFHIGAITPRKNVAIPNAEMFDANVRACLCLGMWAFRKNIPVVYLSSSASYPESPRITEHARLAPWVETLGGFYGFTKILGEEIFKNLAKDGLKLCIFRPSSIYGTGLSADQMVSVFLNRAIAGEDIVVNAPPQSRVNLIHATDVAAAMIKALQLEAVGTFNIASAETHSILHIAQTAISVCTNERIAIQVQQTSDRPFVRFDLDCTTAEQAFGFTPGISLEQGLILMKDNMFSLEW